jgi:ribulose-bisphosphate carboxylase large chain
MPVPAGGLTIERVPGLRELYGDDTMFLIGGSLLAAGDALAARCQAFVHAVRAPCHVGDGHHA